MKISKIIGCFALALLTCGPSIEAANKTARVLQSPAAFEPNRGQSAPRFDYVATGFGYTIGLAPTRVETLTGAPGKAIGTVGLNFVGASANAKPTAIDKQKLVTNYLWGKESFTGIPTFAKVRYANVWNGVDLIYYGNDRKFEYDMVVAPNADPSQIRLQFDADNRAELTQSGDLRLHTKSGELTQRKPLAYQEKDGVRSEVAASYVRAADGSYAIQLGKYDRSRELVIDPVILVQIPSGAYVNGTDLGASVDARATATDSVGTYTYVAGTAIVNYNNLNAYNAYAEAYDNSGHSVRRVALGVQNNLGNSYGLGVASDQVGNVYVTGYTDDTTGGYLHNFALQSSPGGGKDGFLTKLNPVVDDNVGLNAVLYSTYLGGNGDDYATSVSTDVSTSNAATGTVYVGGFTSSTNFPTTGRPAGQHGWLYALNTSQSGSNSKIFGIGIGGSGTDAVNGLSTDTSLNVFVGGATTSQDFSPMIGTGYKTSKNNTNNDGFLLKINPSGTTLWSTFLPGGAINAVTQLTGQYGYVTGITTGALDITSNGYQVTAPSSSSANHAFFSRFDTSTSGTAALNYSTYLGGQATESGNGIAVQLTTSTQGGSVNGRAMIVGSTTSPNFPTKSATNFPTPTSTFTSTQDGFLAYVDPGQAGAPGLSYSTLLTSSSGPVSGYGISTDIYGEAAVAYTGPGSNGTGGYLVKYGNQIWGKNFYVTQLYADLLNRNPDSGGLSYWTTLLLNTTTYPQGVETCDHTMTRTEEATCFSQSQEFTQWGLVIVKYYLAAWSTTPDYAGWVSNFSTVVNSNTPTPTLTGPVFANFIASPNFTNVYGSVNNSTFVNKAYTNLLGRSPTTTELNSALSGSQTSVMLGLIQGSEYGNRVFAQAYANLMYMGFLRRNGDSGGLAFWQSTLANQANLNAVISFFSTSQEYFNRFQ